MMVRTMMLAMLIASSTPVAAQDTTLPRAIFTDPPADVQHPARMEVLHVPSGGVEINGVAYLAAGPGPHPTLVICHGWPGNEKNLDLAQAVRRAGWNAVTFNYRGSWGSPGAFRFANNLDDARAVLAYLRDPAHADALGVDPDKIALIGHSMGGWVSAMVGGKDPRLLGTGLISAANMGLLGTLPRADLIADAASDAETLAGTSPEIMAEELAARHADFDFLASARALSARPLLVLAANDGLAPHTDALVAAIEAMGGKKVTAAQVQTDHGWSDHRIDLEARVIRWLQSLAPTALEE